MFEALGSDFWKVSISRERTDEDPFEGNVSGRGSPWRTSSNNAKSFSLQHFTSITKDGGPNAHGKLHPLDHESCAYFSFALLRLRFIDLLTFGSKLIAAYLDLSICSRSPPLFRNMQEIRRRRSEASPPKVKLPENGVEIRLISFLAFRLHSFGWRSICTDLEINMLSKSVSLLFLWNFLEVAFSETNDLRRSPQKNLDVSSNFCLLLRSSRNVEPPKWAIIRVRKNPWPTSFSYLVASYTSRANAISCAIMRQIRLRLKSW